MREIVYRCSRHDRHGYGKDVGAGMARAGTGRERIQNAHEEGEEKSAILKKKV